MSTAKIALGDDLILCLQGTEYPIGRVTEVTFLRADTDTVRTNRGSYETHDPHPTRRAHP